MKLMICGSCNAETNHIKVYFIAGKAVEICPTCAGFSEAGGTRLDGVLTRNRFSVRRDSVNHQGDFIVPHKYDRASRTLKPNQDFLNRHPDKAGEYFSREELDKMGYKKLKAEAFQPGKGIDGAEHEGDATERVKELIK